MLAKASLRTLSSRIGRIGKVRFASSATAAPAAPSQPKKAGAGKILLNFVAAAGIGAVVILDVYPEPLLRFAASKAKSEEGVTMNWKSVSGMLHQGKLEFKDLSVRRLGDDCPKDASAFDMNIESLVVGFNVTELLNKHLTKLQLSGVKGKFIRNPDSPPLPPVVIDSFVGRDFAIQVTTKGQKDDSYVPLVITSMDVAPLRFASLPLDLFFSDTKGRLQGQPFEVQKLTDTTPGKFRLEALPIHMLEPMAPPGNVLRWLSGGTLDVSLVTTKHAPAKADAKDASKSAYDLRLEFELGLRSLSVGLPASSTVEQKAAAAPVLAYVNAFSRDLPVKMSMQFSEAELKAKDAPEFLKIFTTRLGDQIAENATNQGKQKLKDIEKAGKETLADLQQKGLDKVKSWWS